MLVSAFFFFALLPIHPSPLVPTYINTLQRMVQGKERFDAFGTAAERCEVHGRRSAAIFAQHRRASSVETADRLGHPFACCQHHRDHVVVVAQGEEPLNATPPQDDVQNFEVPCGCAWDGRRA